MNRTRLVMALLLLGSLGAAQSTAGGAAEIEQLQVKREGSDVTVQVVLTGTVKPSIETATNPDRLVLILPGTVSDAKQKRFPLDANGVRGVRLGLNSANPPVTRVVVDLDAAHPYTLDTAGNRITLRVQPSANAEVVVRHFTPAPAATAPLLGVFRRQPQQPPPTGAATTAQAAIPVPPKLPAINFPESKPGNNVPVTANTAPISTPPASHPKLGSLQQGTVFPGMGTPGAGTVPAAQNVTGTTSNAERSQTSQLSTAQGNAAPLVVKTTPSASAASVANPPSSMTVSIGSTGSNGNGSRVNPASNPGGPAVSTGPTVAANTKPAAIGSAPTGSSAGTGSTSSASTSSAGSPNVTAKVLSATVTPPAETTASIPVAAVANPSGVSAATAPTANGASSSGGISPVATVSNPLGSTTPASTAAVSTSSPSAQASETTPAAATVANPLGGAQPVAVTAASSSASTNAVPAAPQGATVANPLGTTTPPATATSAAASSTPSSASQGATVANPPGASQTSSAAPSAPQGATVSNPLGLAPGETAQIEVVEPADAVEPASSGVNNVVAEAENVAAAGKNEKAADKSIAVAKEVAPDVALMLRATHPDFRTAFHVKYVAAGAAYLDGGRSAGLAEGMKLVVRDTPTGSVVAAADGNLDHLVAELEVTSVAEASAVTDIHTPTRDVKPGDLAYLSAQDEQALVQQSTMSSTRKYPTVISFTEEDALDEEARVQIPRPPMPSVNRARGRVGVDYMGTAFHGNGGGSNTDIGLVARLDMTRIGGTYWNASGYWRGRLTTNNYAGNSTLQDLINRTYHLSMTYDNPNSAWVAGFGRMFLPWAPSLDTIDGGYFGRRMGHGSTLGIFAGTTPDPTSWSYSPNQKIGGLFVNFEGGSYDNFRYTSTSGVGLNAIDWKINRPFIFFENGLYYKRYVALYDSTQIDSPVGMTPGSSPGVGVGRNFLTLRVQPHERVEFDANYSYFRDLPTFDTSLIAAGLLDKYLFQGFSGGVRLEVLKQVWVYTNLGRSNSSGDTKSSLNQLYGLTFGRLPWIHIRADGHYTRFNSSFGSGNYESVSLSRSLGDNFRLEVLGGQQNFVSSLTSNTKSKFVTSNLEMNVGAHLFLQGGFTASRGLTQDYDQWLFTLGYRFDTRRATGQ